MSRYSGEEDVVFGATVAGRPDSLAGAESMVGLFINTLPVRARVRADATVRPWLRELQAQAAEMREFEYSPLVSVQGWSDAPRDKALFETILVFENYPVDAALREQLGSLQIRDVRSREQTNFPITLVSGPGSELGLKISYDLSRFDARAIDAMLGHLATLLVDMAARPAAALSELVMLPHAEAAEILTRWGAGPLVSAAGPATLHEAFEAQVRSTPDAVALVAEEEMLSYAELNRRANVLAAHLRGMGVGPEQLVGLHLERSPHMIVALLATLKAGAAYLPLDPDYPAERLDFMLADSGAPVLLTQQRLAQKIGARVGHIVSVDSLDLGGAAENPDTGAAAGNLAYVIYTSGSTGAPKGVMVEHRNVLNHCGQPGRRNGDRAGRPGVAVRLAQLRRSGRGVLPDPAVGRDTGVARQGPRPDRAGAARVLRAIRRDRHAHARRGLAHGGRRPACAQDGLRRAAAPADARRRRARPDPVAAPLARCSGETSRSSISMGRPRPPSRRRSTARPRLRRKDGCPSAAL